ncbi:MAG: hypothetical protein KBB95_12030 [Deltaproteobacteria bacterium]|nr:hypothetical protein [Deltaproteobacteria bacterium]
MTDLNIDVICANSAAAKRRVERNNKTLQDRLVKELRLRGISTMEDANAFLPEFMVDYNARFATPPFSEHNAHRPLLPGERLDDIFQLRNRRKVSKSLTLNYKGQLYVLEPTTEANAPRGSRVDVFEADDGTVRLRAHGVEFPANVFQKHGLVSVPRQQGAVVPNKHLSAVLTLIREHQLIETQEKLDKARSYRERTLLRGRVEHAASS